MSSTLRTNRSARRAFSRDAARQFSRPGTNTATVPDVATVVHGHHPLPHRIVTPKSGKLRINTKRNARAAFWTEERRTVLVQVSAQMEPYFGELLPLLGGGARIDGRTPIETSCAFDLAVHIPGAPSDAVKAVLGVTWRYNEEGSLISARLETTEWFRADGKRIEPERSPMAEAFETVVGTWDPHTAITDRLVESYIGGAQ